MSLCKVRETFRTERLDLCFGSGYAVARLLVKAITEGLAWYFTSSLMRRIS